MTGDSEREETDGRIVVLWRTGGLDTACTGVVVHREVERCDDVEVLTHKICRLEKGKL